jgi:sugar phosphate isomerase/epimerase
MQRRTFLKTTLAAAAAVTSGIPDIIGAAGDKRKMTVNLVCGAIGFGANQREAIELAARHGFESVEASGDFLAKLPAGELEELLGSMKAKGLTFGAGGMPVEFRKDDATFSNGMKELPNVAAGLKRAGVHRLSTWLMPCHGALTYLQHFKMHAIRLRQVAQVLKDQGVRLGLEYVGPKTSWTSQRYPFIHTMAEMKDLIGEIQMDNVGFLLDSWHWWHAGETEKDILTLKGSDVVAVDLNDAPSGVPKDQMPDGKRELPCATGVIPVDKFLNALNQIGYDGPVRSEPFNKVLNAMSKDDACEASAQALKKAFAMIQ